MNFKVGQKVVCVKPHPDGILEVGKTYTVLNINSECNCDAIDVGIKANCQIGQRVRCTQCDTVVMKSSVWFLLSSRFAPIIENTSTADIANQIFEQHPELKEIKIPELV